MTTRTTRPNQRPQQSERSEKRNEAYFSLKWKARGMWDVGGTYTDENGKQFDLGYSKTAPTGLVDAIAVLVKNLLAALNGKGVPKETNER